MGAIKNIRQIYGTSPVNIVTGKDIWERDYQYQAAEYTPYCQFCGKELVNATQNEIGQPVDPEWERSNRACSKCMQQRMR